MTALWVRGMVAVMAGGLAGTLGFFWFRGPASSPAEQEARVCEVDRRRAMAEVQRLEEQLLADQAALGVARRARAARAGSVLPWPDTVDSALLPEAFRSHLDEALQGTRARILEVDCQAYPCIGVIATRHDPNIDFSFVRAPVEGEANLPGDLLGRLREDGTAYDTLPVLEAGRLAGASSADEETLHAVLFFSPADLAESDNPSDPALAAQDGTRLEQIHGRLTQKLTDWEARTWR